MYANKYHHYVRKLGHMTEYCVLAITLCVPLYAYGVRGIWLYLLAGLICAVCGRTWAVGGGCLHRYVWSHDRHHRNTDCRLGSRKEHERTGKRAETQKKAEKKNAEKKNAGTLIGKEEQ